MAYHDTQTGVSADVPAPPVRIFNPFLRPPHVTISNYTDDRGAMPRGYVVPGWLRDAFNLAKAPTRTISDYPALRKLLSVNDLIMLECFQRINFFGPHLPSLPMMRDWTKSTHSGGMLNTTDYEYNGIICLAANDQALQQEALDQLRAPGTDNTSSILAAADDGMAYYRFEVDATRQYYIHVIPGIFNALQDRTYALRFVSDYLKVLYGFLPVSSVSFTPVFTDYLRLL